MNYTAQVRCTVCAQECVYPAVRPPMVGDFWICRHCGALSQFAVSPAAGLHLALLSDADFQQLDPLLRSQLAKAQKAHLRGGIT
jgi:hypothetical protein